MSAKRRPTADAALLEAPQRVLAWSFTTIIQVRTDGPQTRAKHKGYRALHKLASALYGVIASRRQLFDVATLRAAEVPSGLLMIALACALAV